MSNQDGAGIVMMCGLDVGNGYVKGRTKVVGKPTFDVDLPSCVAYTPQVSWVAAEASDAMMDDLVNNLDCDVMSSSVAPGDRRRILVGRRAAESGRTAIMFDINDSRPKCDDSLSGQLICSSIAAAAIRDAWVEKGSVPSRIDVAAYVTLALPIIDFAGNHERYASMFESGNHTVHVHNFEHEVTVEITFPKVFVIPEGAAAQFAIVSLGEGFMDGLLADAREHGIPCEGETGASVVGYANTIGIDIGEGTVNFPVFRDGKVNVDASSSINRGFGTVLGEVVEQTRGLGWAPESRKDLSEFMLKKAATRRDTLIKSRIEELVKAESDVFVRDIISEYTRVLRRTKLVSDVVYVYGGGADAVRDTLWPRLAEASKLDEGIYMPVIYLDSTLSRVLNRDGLFSVSLAMAEQDGVAVGK